MHIKEDPDPIKVETKEIATLLSDGSFIVFPESRRRKIKIPARFADGAEISDEEKKTTSKPHGKKLSKDPQWLEVEEKIVQKSGKSSSNLKPKAQKSRKFVRNKNESQSKSAPKFLCFKCQKSFTVKSELLKHSETHCKFFIV